MTQHQLDPAGAPAVLRITWKTVALWSLGSAVVGVAGALTALVLVATAKDADALSTIALALAVVAFVIQILVFIAQLFGTNQQITRSEEIYAQFNGLLEGLRGTAQGTQQTLDRHMEVLLKAATGAATEAAKQDTNFDPDEFEQQVIERVRESIGSDGSASRLGWPVRAVATESEALPSDALIRTNLLRTYPTEEEGRPRLETLRRLSPLAVRQLQRFADDELNSLRVGATPGLLKAPGAHWTNELEGLGLVERTGMTVDRAEGNKSYMMSLTDEGRQVARLLSARGRTPDWIRRADGHTKESAAGAG